MSTPYDYRILNRIVTENKELRSLLKDALPWIGISRDGTGWASEYAKEYGRTRCETIESKIKKWFDNHPDA